MILKIPFLKKELTMKKKIVQQQIVISGVGGQGVLFITGLLADAAINKGISVFTSETHGMAQRGGTVISHLKVGDFSSPLIRPGHADGLIALKAENLAQHGAFLKPGGWAAVNSPKPVQTDIETVMSDADLLAQNMGNPKSVNLIVLGLALAKNKLFCAIEDVRSVLEKRLNKKPQMLADSLNALKIGYSGSIA
jgi:indolepyruvate ferredoxin oxidoreductase beta subunit